MSFYNEQIERAVLGEMMHRNKFFEALVEEDFDHQRHRELFRELRRRHEQKLPFTIIDLKDFGLKLFGNLEHATMTTDSTSYFIPSMTIRELKKLTEKRAMARVIDDSAKVLAEEGVAEAMQAIESGMLKIAMEADAPESDENFVYTAISNMEAAYKREGGLSGVPSGIVALDRMTDGFQNNDYVIIAARPSVGKTAIANQFIVHASRYGKKVGFFSAEMAKGKIGERMITSISGVNMQEIRSGAMQPSRFKDIQDAAAEVHSFGIEIDDTPNIDISRLTIRAKRWRREKKIDMLVVDYLGLLSSRTHDRASIYERVTAISRQLKQLARELEIPVIVLAQINRDAEGKEPTLANLRDSGAIEQDADMILMLHRRGESENSAMDLIVAKHRNGPTGRIGVAFDRELQRFVEFREP